MPDVDASGREPRRIGAGTATTRGLLLELEPARSHSHRMVARSSPEKRSLRPGAIAAVALLAVAGCGSVQQAMPASDAPVPEEAPAASRAPRRAPTAERVPAAPERPATGAPDTSPAPWVHAPTGMVFPQAIAGFERDDDDVPEPGADQIAVSYKRFDEKVAIMVTVYLYPQSLFGGSLDENFRAATVAVLDRERGVRLIGEGRMALEQAGRVQEGRRAHFFVDDDAEKLPPQITHLFMFAHGPWFIKYRTIFLAFQHEEADRANLELMRALRWPEADRGRLAGLGQAFGWLAK
jgi:hypothetical protein